MYIRYDSLVFKSLKWILSLWVFSSDMVTASSAMTTGTPFIGPTPVTVQQELGQPCNDINWDDVSEGVQKAQEWLKGQELNRSWCAILKVGQFNDLAEGIENLPENTTIFLTSDVMSDVMSNVTSIVTSTPVIQVQATRTETLLLPAPSPITVPEGRAPKVYSISKPVTLKNGQHILAATTSESEIILSEAEVFVGMHMVAIGSKNMNMSETDTSVIKGITFEPFERSGRDSVDSIIYAQCYNRDFWVLDNDFILDTRASVYMWCKQLVNNDGDADPVGPGFRFTGNTIEGDGDGDGKSFSPDEGLLIFLPDIQGLKNRLCIENNTFTGEMVEGIEASIGLNSTLMVAGNKINISNTGNPRGETGHDQDFYKGGIVPAGQQAAGTG